MSAILDEQTRIWNDFFSAVILYVRTCGDGERKARCLYRHKQICDEEVAERKQPRRLFDFDVVHDLALEGEVGAVEPMANVFRLYADVCVMAEELGLEV